MRQDPWAEITMTLPSQMVLVVKKICLTQEIWVQLLGWEDPLE